MSIRTAVSPILFAAAALLLAPAPSAHAAVLTYTETITDDTPIFFDALDLFRDLKRTRTLGSGAVLVTDDDATIIAENAISDNWGLSALLPLPFSWNHVFVADPVTRFLSATLTLEVFGVNGDLPDLVLVDFLLPVGVLTPGGDGAMSTTILTTDVIGDSDVVNFLLSLFLADNALTLAVLPLLPDFMSIHSSTLAVTYETAVPEPATGLLMLGSLMALGTRSLIRKYRS